MVCHKAHHFIYLLIAYEDSEIFNKWSPILSKLINNVEYEIDPSAVHTFSFNLLSIFSLY